mmetsp:Transcript_46412/g.143268  ORF Transcript_46412/g.143268 Transcript_46412/m.143268 type:complete len:291 (+) Transcript_46412:172-1044(+)
MAGVAGAAPSQTRSVEARLEGLEVDELLAGSLDDGRAGADGRLQQVRQLLLRVVADQVLVLRRELHAARRREDVRAVEAAERVGRREVVQQHRDDLRKVRLQGEEERVGAGVEGVGEHALALRLVVRVHEADDRERVLGRVHDLRVAGAAHGLEVVGVGHRELRKGLEVAVLDRLGHGGHAARDDLLDARLHHGRRLQRDLHALGRRHVLLDALDHGAQDVHLRPVAVRRELLRDAVAAVGVRAHEPLDEAAVGAAARAAGADAGEERLVGRRLEHLDEGAREGAVARRG